MARFDRLIIRPVNRKEVHANLMVIANSLRMIEVQNSSKANPLTIPDDVLQTVKSCTMKLHDALDMLRAQTGEDDWV